MYFYSIIKVKHVYYNKINNKTYTKYKLKATPQLLPFSKLPKPIQTATKVTIINRLVLLFYAFSMHPCSFFFLIQLVYY